MNNSTALKQAIETNRVVTFVYNGKSRTIEPTSVDATADGGTILRGIQGADGYRSFKVDQIADLVVTDTTFVPQA